MSHYLMFAGGLVLLILGGELLVKGAVAIAQLFGMSPLLIGLTLVGFGTSTPELVTSVEAALLGSPGIAVGNIVGSNIANILLILGVSAIIAPIAVGSTALRRDGVVVLAAALMFAAIGYFWHLERSVGFALVAGLLVYLYWAYRQESLKTGPGHTAAFEKTEAYGELHTSDAASVEQRSFVWSALLATGGLALVIGGGKAVVVSATSIAREAGISETVIGLTIVAVGTSLPELITSIVAAVRRHGDIALGNVLGSNIYNTLGIGGATALMSPTKIPPEIVRFDNLVMVAASILLLVFAWTGYRVGRAEGVTLLAGYGLYIFAVWPK